MTIARLPLNVLEEITTHLGVADIANCTLLVKSIHGIFSNNLRSQGFINFVIKADYENVERSVKVLGPEIIFTNMRVRLNDKPENLTPLAYAIKVCDIYMLQCFLVAIQASGNKRLLDRFLRELNQPVNQLDLQPLFDVYNHYFNQCSLWFDKKIDDKQIEKDWLLVGAAQAKYLPWHMLKLFCDDRVYWNEKSPFVLELRPDGKCIISEGRELKLEDLGKQFALVNGGESKRNVGRAAANARSGTPLIVRIASAQRDFQIFKQLFAVRLQDVIKFKQQPLALTKKEEPVAASRAVFNRMFR